MLSEKRKEELKNAVIEAKETEEYLIEQEQALARGSIDQSWHILLTYLSSENLVKHSKRLTWLTIWLAITASAMTGVALVQLMTLPR